MRQRILTLILMVSIIISITTIPASVSAATNGDCGESLKWSLDDNGTLTISGEGEMYDFDSVYDFDTMKTKPSTPWHNKSDLIKAVIIEEGVTRIGNDAFRNCDNLIDATFPNSLIEIGEGAFMFTNLSKVILPDSVKKIGASCFTYCTNLNEIQLGKQVEYIGGEAFHTCKSLNSITIPESVIYIGDCAFSCSNLNTVYYDGSNQQWDTIDKSNTWNYGINSIENLVISYSKNDVVSNNVYYDPNSTTIQLAQENVSVYIDGTKIEFDVQPQIINGRTMVPMRKIFEELGAVVDWDNSTQTAIGTKGSTTIKIAINDYTLYKNGIPNVLDVPAQLIDSRTLVPIRAISESFGCNVEWKQETQSVLINTFTTSTIPTYAKYSTVPDWGAVTGDVLIQEQEIEGAYAYFYQTIDKYKSYECYAEKLEGLNYHLMEAPTTTDEYIWYVFEHKDNSLPYVGIYFENNENSNMVGIAIPDYNGIGNTNGTITTYDIEDYLEKNYNTININDTEYKVSFIVLGNPFDVEGLNYDFEIEPSIQGFSINDNLVSERKSDLSMSEKKQVVEDIKSFIQSYAEDIINKFPEHRIQGQISYGHYKYPNLKLDWVGGSFFNWSNYDTKDFKSSEPSNFRWKTSYDTYKFDFNEYFVDIETNTPVTIEHNRDTIMIYEIKDISYDPTKSKEEDEDIMVDFTLYAGGSGYVYFNMYDEDGNFLDATIESIDAGENEYRQLWHKKTKKIIIADDEDKDGVKKNKVDFEAEVPVTLVGEYSFEGELTIEECILANRNIYKMDLPIIGESVTTTFDFLISARGESAYIYLNFFDDKGRYIDSYYEYIYAKEDVHYYLNDLPENTHSVKFSREKIYK